MKLISIFCLLASFYQASAQIYNFTWSPNPSVELVTNYVIRCVRPIDDTMVVSNAGVSTNFLMSPGPGVWECVLLAQNYTNISDPSNVVIVGQTVEPPPGVVAGLAVNAKWHAGAFDITGTWQLSPGAVSYNAILINQVTGVALLRTGVNRSATWLRVPASTYRLTVAPVGPTGVQGPITMLEMGVTKPGKPKDFR